MVVKRSRSKTLLFATVAVALAGGAMHFASDAWGRSRNAATTAAAKKELAEERARIETVRLPPAVAGSSTELTCNFRDVKLGYLRSKEWMEVRVAAARPQGEVLETVAEKVRKARPEIAKLSEALRCDRLDSAQVLVMDDDSMALSAALIVDGHLMIHDGEVEQGVTRYLEGARHGAHAGAGFAGSGWLASEHAFLALARVMVAHDDAPIDRIAAFLTALEPVLPSPRIFARRFRLALGEAAENAHREAGVPLSAPKYSDIEGMRKMRAQAYMLFYPKSVRYAQAMDVLGEVYRRAEALPDGASPARRMLEADLLSLLATTTNTFVYDLAGSSLDTNGVSGYSTFALARAVARLEALRRAEGRAPASLPAELWAHDPATDASPFGYETTSNGTGYRVWSVGKNGKDDNGKDDDVVVQHQGR